MLLTELQEIIRNGENSGVEFKRADVDGPALAKEIAALANLEGGHILLGVEDDGTVSGLVLDPQKTEERVMNFCRDSVNPAIIPFWETIVFDQATDQRVGVISIPANAPDKPYKARRGGHWITMIRVGTTSREVTRDEEARLYQASGLLRYELRAVAGATLDDLDLRRLDQYFVSIRQQDAPSREDDVAWENLLVNVELMRRDAVRAVPTVAGMLLFGKTPRRVLPQSGIRAIAYQTPERDYATTEDSLLAGPLLPFLQGEEIQESGVIDSAINFARRHLLAAADIDGSGRRQDSWSIPLEVIREAIVNAVAHRDYSMGTMDIEFSIFPDRVEVISPGRLPNGVSVSSMKDGIRASRNELIKETLRDYRFIDARGLGVPRKLIAMMRELNGTEAELIEEENRFVVRLLRR
jgi:ATP-dependent DNA helicase RecG